MTSCRQQQVLLCSSLVIIIWSSQKRVSLPLNKSCRRGFLRNRLWSCCRMMDIRGSHMLLSRNFTSAQNCGELIHYLVVPFVLPNMILHSKKVTQHVWVQRWPKSGPKNDLLRSFLMTLKMVQICSKSVVKIGLVLLSTTCWDISAEINRKLCTLKSFTQLKSKWGQNLNYWLGSVSLNVIGFVWQTTKQT